MLMPGPRGLQMLLKWGVQRGTPVLVRSRTPAHIESNMDVFDWKLDEFEKVRCPPPALTQRDVPQECLGLKPNTGGGA